MQVGGSEFGELQQQTAVLVKEHMEGKHGQGVKARAEGLQEQVQAEAGQS